MQQTPSREIALEAGPTRARRSAAALLATLALVLTALVTGAATASPASATTVEDVFTHKLNHERTSRGLPPLTVRSSLVWVARAQAARMASQDRLYHNPNLTSDVKNWRWVGENVGYGPDALTVHVAFMQSPGHRANILDTDYTEVGIGAFTVGSRVWVAEVFRRPLRVTTSSTSHTSTTHHHKARFPDHKLRHGDTGKAVKRVQRRLDLRDTGYYNWRTHRAVRHFQRHQGWKGSGNVGRHTWRRLF